jgi:hypothetical protein
VTRIGVDLLRYSRELAPARVVSCEPAATWNRAVTADGGRLTPHDADENIRSGNDDSTTCASIAPLGHRQIQTDMATPIV